MKLYNQEFPIERMAKIMGVSRSGYYRFLKEKSSLRNQEEEQLIEKIRLIHQGSFDLWESSYPCRIKGHGREVLQKTSKQDNEKTWDCG